MRVAVTGGSGFIGGRLVAALAAGGHDVLMLSRRPREAVASHRGRVTPVLGDLTTGEGLPALVADAEVLFHCAGEILDVARMPALHVDGTQRLIDAAAGHVRRWVQLSSTGAYGPRRSGAVLEDAVPRPVGTYEETKLASDLMVAAAGRSGAFDHVILRPSIVYGPDMPNQSLFALMRMVRRRAFFFVGRPGASANYIHVDNVVNALMACGFYAEASGQTFNLSDHCSMEEFVGTLATAMCAPRPFVRLPESPVRAMARLMAPVRLWPLTESRVDALTSFVTYPSTHIESRLGYRHRVSMQQGLSDLARSMQTGAT